MNEIPIPTTQEYRESVLVEKYFPLLRSVIQLATAAEKVLDYRPAYQSFLFEAAQLVRDFQFLCEAGNEDQMHARFRSVICCIQAAQVKAEQSMVN